ncbi:MAG TPA: hypothetical protein PLW88_07445 [Syntrophorhabdaceae bacterium]|nr:hypothetical protein [Syntrophorhabdaceae bacterium]HPP07191.1 hypothetical protein [Syntrophorhabdaceae bacterium]
MWKIISNIIEIFIYSAVYLFIAIVAIKIFGASISADFEKRISMEGNLGLSIICGCFLIGISIVISLVFR